jgi:ABC-2 type transport system permease protein
VPRLIGAEMRKLFSTRAWLWLAGAAMALTALYVVLSITLSHLAGSPALPLDTAAGQRTLLQDGSAAEPFAAVLGALAVTGELRHRTAVFTFLATPRRARVLVAKLATNAILGGAFGAICTGLTLAVALPWLAERGIHVNLADHAIPATLIGVVAATAIFAVIGVGFGALVANQLACIVALLVYLLLLDPLLLNIGGAWHTYLPGAAADALTHVTQIHSHLLPAWQGGLVLLAYGGALAVAGTLALDKRDLA